MEIKKHINGNKLPRDITNKDTVIVYRNSGWSIPSIAAGINNWDLVYYYLELPTHLLEHPVPVRTNPYELALDNQLVAAGIGTVNSFKTPADALQALISWEISLAIDPKVNGGYILVNPLDSKPPKPNDDLSELTEDLCKAIVKIQAGRLILLELISKCSKN